MQTSDLGGLSLLVVEDEPFVRKQIAAQLEKIGMDITSCDNVQAARKWARDMAFDFALIDVNLPDGVGTDLLRERAFSGHTAVIIMTAHGGVNGAVEAMRMGAIDYLTKPFDPAELPIVLQRARRTKQSARVEEHRRVQTGSEAETFFFGAALAPLEELLAKIVAADQRMRERLSPVLIQGETGTGKTTIARWLHYQGPRAAQPLVEVNCSALPETLAESELFGHERGAFTDARATRIGLFEAGNGGTLFLDELPSLSLPLQAKVLKAVEDHRIRRLGGNKELPVDVRLIGATNSDLKRLVTEGKFREDLYHRLDLFRIQIPPLRDRGEDILRLAELLVGRLCQRHRLPTKQITAKGKQRLMQFSWSGNVRELSHELERAIVFEDRLQLDFEHLVASSPPEALVTGNDWLNASFIFPPEGFSLDEAINRFIQRALQQTNNNVSAAARLLGVSRDFLRYRLAHKGESNLGNFPDPRA